MAARNEAHSREVADGRRARYHGPMTSCARCGNELPGGSRFCPSCGAAQTASQLPTAVAGQEQGAPRLSTPSLPIGRLGDSTLMPGRFAPGDMVLGRYRIVGLLGRGGMGEVYRADDLKLAQPVSLKFLPRRFAEDRVFLDLFLAEVRNARQVSHPNVCRVYDIGELDSVPFLTMEYVDGEDLATLLRRIGRLPPAKATEVARQLCAGLAAAHEKGVVHRDLKPSNVMIDGNGRARITDFGLAVRADQAATADPAGTPAYMAPEQFSGQPVTARSDLYSLGLILYEMYTGKRPFQASSTAEWRSRHLESQPTSPADVERDIDDAVERVILRCLEKDPSRRPSSALQIAAALPGGDPLAAALAAGETPSPEMVAAAGGEGAVSTRVAWGLLLGTMVTLAAFVAITPFSTDLGLSPLTKSREILRERARSVLATFGYGREALDSEGWFVRSYGPIRYLADHMPSPEWRRQMRRWPAPVLFTYRQSPRRMVSKSPDGRITEDQPSHEVSGMATVVLDANGALTYLRAEPPQVDSTSVASSAFDWKTLFDEASLDFSKFTSTAPRWVPPSAYDQRAEWTGEAPWTTGIPLRVAAASYRGRPVYFDVLGPWSKPLRMERPTVTLTRRIADGTIGLFFLVMIAVSIVFMRRNLLLGRSDRRGALRLALFMLSSEMLAWIAGAHHVPEFRAELDSGLLAASIGLQLATLAGLLYLALEPYLRRQMPELLIGWARLLEGRFRDPRVGRDVLSGALAGTLQTLMFHVTNALPTWIPIAGQTTVPPGDDMLSGGRWMIAPLLRTPEQMLLGAITFCTTLFLLRLVFKRTSIATVGLIVLVTLANLGGENVALETPGALLWGILIGLVLTRLGLLALVTMLLVYFVLQTLPLPIVSDAPYALSSALVLAGFVVLSGYAFRRAIGPGPALGAALEE